MESKSRPEWADEYLWMESWTQRQFTNLLCGRSGDPVGESTEQGIEWEQERARMEVHVRSAIRAGRLSVLPSIGEPRLLKLIDALDPVVSADMQRAVVADRFYGSDFHLAVDEAIRWSVRVPERFPLFPFTNDDLSSVSTAVDNSKTNVRQKDVESPLGTRERTTLLVVIAGLAEAAGIDLSKPSKAGEMIETLTMEVGARVSARTIEDLVKRIPDAIERRGPTG